MKIVSFVILNFIVGAVLVYYVAVESGPATAITMGLVLFLLCVLAVGLRILFNAHEKIVAAINDLMDTLGL